CESLELALPQPRRGASSVLPTIPATKNPILATRDLRTRMHPSGGCNNHPVPDTPKIVRDTPTASLVRHFFPEEPLACHRLTAMEEGCGGAGRRHGVCLGGRV